MRPDLAKCDILLVKVRGSLRLTFSREAALLIPGYVGEKMEEVARKKFDFRRLAPRSNIGSVIVDANSGEVLKIVWRRESLSSLDSSDVRR